MTTNDKLAGALITHDEAAEAVESMDDCAKMDISVDPIGARTTLERYIAQQCAASLAAPPAQGEWQPIETAPKEVGKVVMLGNCHGAWAAQYMPVYGSGWRPENPWTSMMLNHEHMRDAGGVLNHAPATHWKPWPAAAPQPAPAPVQVDVLGELADEIEATYPNADASNLRAFAADAQPPAPGEAVLPPIERDRAIGRDYIPLPGGWEVQTRGRGSTFRICDTKSGERVPVVETMLHPWLERMAREVHAAIAALAQRSGDDLAEQFRLGHAAGEQAALAQQRVPDAVREVIANMRRAVERADAGKFAIYDPSKWADQLESALATIDQQQEARK